MLARSVRSPLHDVRQQAARCFAHHAARQFSWTNKPGWWSQTGSNRRPPACKAGALPTELWPRAERAFERRAGERVVVLGRFELPTSRLSSDRSNQLSYKPSTAQSGSNCLTQCARQNRHGLVHEERETQTAVSRLWT